MSHHRRKTTYPLAIAALIVPGMVSAAGNPPIIDSTSPTGEAEGPVVVSITAHDPDGGTLEFDAEVDCPSGRRQHSGAGTTSFSFDTYPEDGESCAVYATVTDPDGNQATAAWAFQHTVYYVRSGPPVAAFDSPRNGDPLNNTVLATTERIVLRALGPGEVDRVVLYVDEEPWLDERHLAGASELRFSARDMPAGAHRLKVVVADTLGLESEPVFVDVGIASGSNARPTVQITNPANDASIPMPGPVPFAVAANDPDGVVDRVEYFSKGLRIGTAENPPFALNWIAPGEGGYSIAARAYGVDGVGSVMSPAVGFTVTPAPPNLIPLITDLQPANNSVYGLGSQVVMSAVANDQDGTALAGVRFRVLGTTFDQIDATVPYSVAWPADQSGTLTIEATAIDDVGPPSAAVTRSIQVNTNTTAAVTLLTPNWDPPGSATEGSMSIPSCTPILVGGGATDYVPRYNRHVYLPAQALPLSARVLDNDNNVSTVRFERVAYTTSSTQFTVTLDETGPTAGAPTLFSAEHIVQNGDATPTNSPRVQWLRAAAVEPGTTTYSARAPIAVVPANVAAYTCIPTPGTNTCYFDFINQSWPVRTIDLPAGSALIEAEQFDGGGQGISFFEIDESDALSQERRDWTDVDFDAQVCSGGDCTCDSLSDPTCVIKPSAGEWMKYSIRVVRTGSYRVWGRFLPAPASQGNPCPFAPTEPNGEPGRSPIGSISIGGSDGSAPEQAEGSFCDSRSPHLIPATGGECELRTVNNLPQGDYVITYIANNGARLDHLRVERLGSQSGTPEVTLMWPQDGAVFAPLTGGFATVVDIRAEVGGGGLDENGGVPIPVEFQTRPLGSGTFQLAAIDADQTRPFVGPWTVPGTEGVTHEVRARAQVNGTWYDSPPPYTKVTIASTGNHPPSIAMSAPANGQQFSVGEQVTLRANAVDQDGNSITVQFFARRGTASPIMVGGPDGSAPYEAVWAAPLDGTWALYAEARDSVAPPNQGVATAAPRSVQVVLAGGGVANPDPPVLAPVPAPDTSTDVVGATTGEFRVDEAGNATYSIPLRVLPGTAGVAPSLSLSYNSSGGDGYLGVGWSLSGLQSISRCRRAVEGGDSLPALGPTSTGRLGHDALRFTDDGVERDMYCLNDQRLIKVNSVEHGAVNAEYRTEIDAFAKVTIADAGALNVTGAEQFVVEGKDGTRTTFGGTNGYKVGPENSPPTVETRSRLPVNKATGGADGVIQTQEYLAAGRGAIMRWSQSRVEDSVGNTIDYFYEYGATGSTAFGGEQFIKEIHYAGHTSGKAPQARVVFTYSAVDPEYALTSGMLLKRSQRLDRIELFEGSSVTPVRWYVLVYGDSASTGQRRLLSIQECAHNGDVDACLPKTRFEWLSPPPGATSASISTVANEVFNDTTNLKAAKAVKFGDVNGDGLTDLVWARNLPGFERDICWSIAAPTGFTYQTTCNASRLLFKLVVDGQDETVDHGNFHLFDFNADGRDDLLFAPRGGTAWRIALSTSCAGGGYGYCGTSLASGISTGGAGQLQMADFNGDGLLDAIYGVGFQSGGVGSGQNPFDPGTPCNNCYPLDPESPAEGVGRDPAGVPNASSGFSDPGRNVRPVISVMARAGVGNVECAPGLTYCFAQAGTVGGYPATAVMELNGPHTVTCNGGGDPIHTKFVQFDGGIDIVDFDGDGVNDLRVKVVPGDACNALGFEPHWVIYRNNGWRGDPPAQGQTNWTPKAFSFVEIAALPVGTDNGEVDTSASIGWRPDETFDYRFQVGDINGDGLSDLVYRTQVGGVRQWVYRLNTGRVEALGAPNFGFQLGLLEPRVISGLIGSLDEEKSFQLLDYDGDGNADLLYGRDEGGPTGIRRHYIRRWVGGSQGFGAEVLLPNVVSNASQDSERSSFVDLDGDGRADQVLVDYDGPSAPQNEIILRRAKATPVDSAQDLRRHVPTDRIYRIVNGFGAKTEISYSPLTVFATHRIGADTATTVFGRGSNTADLRPAMYVVREAASSAPAYDTTTNQYDTAAMSRVAYRYRGARMQAGGRGFLGFEEVQSFDWQTKVEVSTTYEQSFPLIGRALGTYSKALQDGALAASGWGTSATLCALNPSGTACFSYPEAAQRQWPVSAGTQLSSGTTVHAYVAYDATGYPPAVNAATGLASPPSEPRPLFVYTLDSATRSFELVGGAEVGHERNTFTSYDAYGNLIGSRSEVLDAAAAVVRSVTTANTYGPSPEDQRFGRLTESTVTTQRGSDSATRKVGFRYAPGTRLLIGELIDPDGGVDSALIKAYTYDAYGNKLKAASCSAWHLQSWPSNKDNAITECANTARADLDFSATTTPSTVFDRVRRYTRVEMADRRFVARELSGFASSPTGDVVTLTVTGRNAYGDPLQVDDVNNVTTLYGYDAFGRKFFESSDTGSWSKTTLRYCTGQAGEGVTPPPQTETCPSTIGAVYVGTTTHAGAPSRKTYFDTLGREVLSVGEGFAVGEYIATRTAYDNLGRVVRKGVPTKVSQWTTVPDASQDTKTSYDKTGRVVSVASPDANAPGGLAMTTTAYGALSVAITPPYNKNGFRDVRTEYRNRLGEIVRVVDANSLAACYAYKSTGELTTVWRQDGGTCPSPPPAGSAVTTTNYDQLGRKLSMWDADKGNWSFRYNAAGEAIREIAGRGQCTQTRYDARGRVVAREDWTGGTTSACSGTLEHQSLWAFDTRSVGAVATETVNLGATELQRKMFDYDALGRPIRAETRITDSGQSRTYWNSTTYDHYGRVFQELFESPEFPAQTGVLHEYTDEDTDGAQLNDGYFRRLRDPQGMLAGAVHYEAFEMDAFGNVTRERRAGNTTLETVRTYDLQTGRIKAISTGNGAVQSWSYEWDAVGNLDSRRDRLLNYEAFNYDALNRLVNDPIATDPISYSKTGNILTKSGATYEYGASVSTPACSLVPGPHAVRKVTQAGGTSIQYCYDASGNQVRSLSSDAVQANQTERLIAYTVAEQASRIQYRLAGSATTVQGSTSRFDYGAGRERIRRRDYGSFSAADTATPESTTHYVGGAEVILKPAGGSCAPQQLNVTVRREYMGMVLTQVVPATSAQCTPAPLTRREFRFVDHLGSTDALFDGAAQPVGGISAQQRFDAFGRRRQSADWQGIVGSDAFVFPTDITRKGYTGHEQLDSSGLIHMNGRVYDPFIARFIQADPIVQDPFNTQSLNRYTYVLNNPLAHTDPSGFSARPRWINYAMTAVAIYIAVQTGLNPQAAMGLASTATLTTAQTAYLAAATGFVTGAIQTGSPKGALQGAVTGLAFFSVGQFANGLDLSQGHVGRALLHGVTGGVLAELQGGSFGHGFVSAGATKFLSANIQFSNDVAAGIGAALIGGTIDQLTGGKFANGAVTAALQWAFNQQMAPPEYVEYEELSPRRSEYYGQSPPGWSAGTGFEIDQDGNKTIVISELAVGPASASLEANPDGTLSPEFNVTLGASLGGVARVNAGPYLEYNPREGLSAGVDVGGCIRYLACGGVKGSIRAADVPHDAAATWHNAGAAIHNAEAATVPYVTNRDRGWNIMPDVIRKSFPAFDR